MPRLPQLQLQPIEFKPFEFKPMEFKPQEMDLSPLEHGLQTYENRVNQANAAAAGMEKSFASIRNTLAQDDETKAFLNQKFAEYRENYIDKYIRAGDYGTAIRNGTRMAEAILNDSEIVARKNHFDDYKKVKESIQKRSDLTDIDKERWENQYQYNWNIRKSDGSFGYDFDDPRYEDFMHPVASLDKEKSFVAAVSLIQPKVTSTANKTTNQTGSANTNADGTGSSSSNLTASGSTLNITDIPISKIIGNLNNYFKQDTQHYQQLQQAYDTAIYQYEKAKRNYDALPEGHPRKNQLKAELDKYNDIVDPVTGEYVPLLFTDAELNHNFNGKASYPNKSFASKLYWEYAKNGKVYNVTRSNEIENRRSNSIDNSAKTIGRGSGSGDEDKTTIETDKNGNITRIYGGSGNINVEVKDKNTTIEGAPSGTQLYEWGTGNLN